MSGPISKANHTQSAIQAGTAIARQPVTARLPLRARSGGAELAGEAVRAADALGRNLTVGNVEVIPGL